MANSKRLVLKRLHLKMANSKRLKLDGYDNTEIASPPRLRIVTQALIAAVYYKTAR